MQPDDEAPTVAATAASFNTTPEIVRECSASEWMFLNGLTPTQPSSTSKRAKASRHLEVVKPLTHDQSLTGAKDEEQAEVAGCGANSDRRQEWSAQRSCAHA